MNSTSWKEEFIKLIESSNVPEDEYQFMYWFFIFKNKKEG